MVAGTLWISVVARMNMRCSGGSSKICTATVSQLISDSVPPPWGTPNSVIIAISIATICIDSHAPPFFLNIPQWELGFHYKSVTIFSFR